MGHAFFLERALILSFVGAFVVGGCESGDASPPVGAVFRCSMSGLVAATFSPETTCLNSASDAATSVLSSNK